MNAFLTALLVTLAIVVAGVINPWLLPVIYVVGAAYGAGATYYDYNIRHPKVRHKFPASWNYCVSFLWPLVWIVVLIGGTVTFFREVIPYWWRTLRERD